MTEKDLKANLNFVEESKEHLLKEHKDKYLLVFEKELISSYDTYDRAAEEGVRQFGIDANFLVHHLPEKEPTNFIMEADL